MNKSFGAVCAYLLTLTLKENNNNATYAIKAYSNRGGKNHNEMNYSDANLAKKTCMNYSIIMWSEASITQSGHYWGMLTYMWHSCIFTTI